MNMVFKLLKHPQLLLLSFAFAILQIFLVYSPIIKSEEPRNSSSYEVAKLLMDKDIKIACSTFEHANTIMCLTNSSVTVRAIDSMKQMNPCQWLTNKDWFTSQANTPVACIATDLSLNDFEEYLAHSKNNVLEQYDIDIYHVYILEHDYH